MFTAPYFLLFAAHLLRFVSGYERIVAGRKCPQKSGLCTGDDWVSFQIYGRNDKETGRPVHVAFGTSNITDAGYKQNASIAILIHGYADSSRSFLLVNIKNELLRNSDMLVVMMDWSKLVPGGCYFTSVYNIRYAGGCLSDLITSMNRPSSGLHVIGFSLGGHVPAAAADYLAPYKIPRITGLDPALPLFWGYFSQRRLRKNDGIFVDVVHTNAFIEGHFLTLGHVDFFVNGGVIQPGCGSTVLDKIGCSHARAPMYYNESINTEVGFWGCTTRYLHIEGSCKPENVKWLMGYHVDTNLQGIVIVKTASTSPFALGKP
ncbi:pancreatic triacylglycerol lipase [Halyomorpha halys]|uniref:pancreatic triacylglycerol lipase n=1 Tax=Halyomorpha halys TaxID=286706 RepID=UPI0006D4F6FE|nr:pancreatic triacylglycerol lipase-like [Halyomorpha halys]XP_024216997.1 pancreatic triacylglycerol lipase-like [Halyomorpha halys]